jgi:hypothetical protein
VFVDEVGVVVENHRGLAENEKIEKQMALRGRGNENKVDAGRLSLAN